jgi:hypothetical protein
MFQQADPCDQYANGGDHTELTRYFWEFAGNTGVGVPTADNAGGVSGAGSIVFPPDMDSDLFYEWTPGGGNQLVLVQGYVRLDALPGGDIDFISINEGGGAPVEGYRLKLKANGSISVEAHSGGVVSFDSPVVLTSGVYYYIEFKCNLADAGLGFFVLRINGIEQLNETGLSSGLSWPNLVHLGFKLLNPGINISVDDVLIFDGDNTDGKSFIDFKGEKRMTCFLPTSDVGGVYTNWAPGTLTNFDEVNDPLPGGADGDATVCTPVDITNRNLFYHSALPVGTTGIIGCFCLHELKSDLGSLDNNFYRSAVRNPVAAVDDVSLELVSIVNAGTPASYQLISRGLFHVDPTAVPWTEALINALQFGVIWQLPQ